MSGKNLFIPVTEEYHQEVKEYCIKRKISISTLVIRLVTKEMFKSARKDRLNVKQS